MMYTVQDNPTTADNGVSCGVLRGITGEKRGQSRGVNGTSEQSRLSRW